MHICMHVLVGGARVEGGEQLAGLVLSSHHVGSKNSTQVVRLGSKHPHLEPFHRPL